MKKKILKPRNLEFVAAKFRKAGPHGKTKKAQRRSDKINLKKEY